jgi:hypothetical protein
MCVQIYMHNKTWDIVSKMFLIHISNLNILLIKSHKKPKSKYMNEHISKVKHIIKDISQIRWHRRKDFIWTYI